MGIHAPKMLCARDKTLGQSWGIGARCRLGDKMDRTTRANIWTEETSGSCCYGPPFGNKGAPVNQLQDPQPSCSILHRRAASITP